jgi:hypothetical protein
MPKVYNKKHPYPKDAIYIGRPSKWGNPFLIGRDGTREEVISKYRIYLQFGDHFLLDELEELKGKNLLCFCKPLPCHGDILLEFANKE